jgi:hypothetical protein
MAFWLRGRHRRGFPVFNGCLSLKEGALMKFRKAPAKLLLGVLADVVAEIVEKKKGGRSLR